MRCYPRVKQERDSLTMEVAHLKEKVVALESEVSTKNELSSQLSKREAEITGLAGKLAELGKELTSLRNFKVKLPDGGLQAGDAPADNQDVGNDFIHLAVVNWVRPFGHLAAALYVFMPRTHLFVLLLINICIRRLYRSGQCLFFF